MSDDELSAWIDANVAGRGRVWGEAFAASGYVLVARHGVPIFQRACGMADRDRQVAPDADTRFRIGSVTKQMTAVAILQLVEAGKLDLEDPLRRTVPEYPPRSGDGITIRHLLTHTSGIPNLSELVDAGTWSATRRTNAEVLARVEDLPVHFTPGAEFRYSNTNYYLLAMIIERLSGLTYDDYLRQQVFGPAAMTRSSATERAGADGDAVGYKLDANDRLVPADPIDLSVPSGGGGVRSTAKDLLRWQRALYTGTTLLTAASRARMLTPFKQGYALGIGHSVIDGHPIYQHLGGINGFGSGLSRIEDLAVDGIVLFNTEGIGGGVLSSIVEMIVHGRAVPAPPEPNALPVDRATMDSVAGDYLATDDGRKTLAKAFPPALAEATSHLALRADGSRLTFDVHMGDPIPLYLGEDGLLFTKRNGIVLTLDRDAAGRVRGVTVTQNRVFVVPFAR